MDGLQTQQEALDAASWRSSIASRRALDLGLPPAVLLVAAFPAAPGSASRSRARWFPSPDLLLLDEPTNHLDIESILGWRNFCWRYGARCSSSRTTAPSCDGSPPASWSSTAAASRAGRVYAPTTAQEGGSSRPRRGERARSTRSSRRKRHGSARVSRPGAPATTAASGARGDARPGSRPVATAPARARQARRGRALRREGRRELEDVSKHLWPTGRRVIASDFSTVDPPRREDRHHRPQRPGKTTLLKLLLGQLQPTAGT